MITSGVTGERKVENKNWGQQIQKVDVEMIKNDDSKGELATGCYPRDYTCVDAKLDCRVES